MTLVSTWHDDASRFRAIIGPTLAACELANNLVLSVAAAVAAGEYDTAHMLTLHEGDRLALAAIVTPPFRLLLSEADPAVLPAAADAIRGRRLRPPGVVAPATVADAFAAAWALSPDVSIIPKMAMTLLAADRVAVPRPARGHSRVAEPRDVEWLRVHVSRFADEVGFGAAERELMASSVDARVAQRVFQVWEADGEIVSFCRFSEVTRTSARIGPVYTAPSQRGRGYAAGCVSALARRLFENRRRWCMLFADVDNPASNRVYERLGFRPVGSYHEFAFGYTQ